MVSSGVNKDSVGKLRKVQNVPCCIVFRLDKMSHVKPYLEKLHWLPISYHILYKYNLFIFKAINLSQYPYLSPLIKSSSLTCGNRLSVSLACPRKPIGTHGFVTAAPTEWNRLPIRVRSQQTSSSFRSQLRAYLSRLAYHQP